ncbi:E3 ubiquitin-protein ligase Topors-like isoform X1 [Chiroxiphia lanceolata]|uniref:E3 ubiquitin-protein ligase Topors-like isoform X1 n=2 Tax=Chiroxiphia lanceolata TaxID=296741 RepID=UPI0013CF22BB|nr:E3 ubiquitin-protein ligase Topors-like isoform X1 [Chiroxiphia lanceolata]
MDLPRAQAPDAVAERPGTSSPPSQFLLAHVRESQMAEEVSPGDGTSSPTASTNQVPQAVPPCDTENLMCPICMDTIKDQVSVSWCSHSFCFPCILQWSRNTAVCPICREPFQYLLRKVGDNNYEVYSIGYYISFVRPNRAQRARRRSAGRRRNRFTGRQQRSSSSRERGTGRARTRERERSRSSRRHHRSHSRGQHAQDYDSSSSRSRQQSWAEDTSTDTSSDEDHAERPEQDAPARLRRSDRHQQGHQVSSREPQATRSRSRRTSHSPDGHRGR